MANGKVCTGFSDPFVAKYACAGGAVTFSGGMPLARGVNVSISPDVSDGDVFYADNQAAESDEGQFTGGTVKLTVDGLHQAAERFIYGLPEPVEVPYGENQKAMMTKHGKSANAPYVGVGVVVRYQSAGVTTYVPIILVKAKFKTAGTEAATQEEGKNWQTQDLEASLHRDDTESADWKWVGEDMNTRDEALAVLKGILNVAAPATGEG